MSDVNAVHRKLLELLEERSSGFEEEKERSTGAKKDLGRATKEFRQSNSPDLSSFKSLLKAYQAEIDALNKASKRSDEVVTTIHEQLIQSKDSVYKGGDEGGGGDDNDDDNSDDNGDNSELVESLRSSNSELNATLQSLRDEHASLKSARESDEEWTQNLIEENQKLKANGDNSELVESLRSSNSELNATLQSLRDENASLKSATESNSEATQNLLSENEKLKAMSLANVALSEESLKKVNSEVDSLRLKLQMKESAVVGSSSILDQIKEENESLKAMLANNAQGEQTAIVELRKSQNAVEEKTMQVEMYREQIDEASKSQEGLNEEVSKLKSEVGELKVKVKSSTVEISRLKKAYSGVSGKDSTIKKLTQEITEYEEEFKSLKNQDLTISKLNKQIKQLQAGGDDDVNRRVEEEREEIEDRAEEKVKEALEREAESLRKVEQLELDLKAERAGKVALDNNFMKAQEGSGSMEASFLEQRKIFLQDSERLNVELHDLTKERDALLLKLSVGGAGVGDNGWEKEKDGYEAELREVSGLLTESREQIKTLMDDAEKASESMRKGVVVASELEAKHKAEVEGLKRELRAAPSVGAFNNMKRDLGILRKLTGGGEDDGEEGGWEGDEDIDSVVLARCQKLETDLMKALQAKEEVAKVSEERKATIGAIEDEKAGLERLITQLEEESATLQAKLRGEDAGEEGGGLVVRGGVGGALLQTILDAKTPVKGVDVGGGGIGMSPMPPFTPGTDGDVQGILMSQRDRLKEKVASLEKMRDGLKKELAEQVRSNEGLKAQNQSLYERVRFAESSFGGGSGGGGGGGGGGGAINDVASLEEGFSRKHDPFADFQKAARKKQLDKLGPVEKVVYSVLRVASGHREARLGLFGYAIALHFLIFVTTYHWAHEMTCGDVLHPDLQGHAHAVAMHGGVPHIEDYLLPEE